MAEDYSNHLDNLYLKHDRLIRKLSSVLWQRTIKFSLPFFRLQNYKETSLLVQVFQKITLNFPLQKGCRKDYFLCTFFESKWINKINSAYFVFRKVGIETRSNKNLYNFSFISEGLSTLDMGKTDHLLYWHKAHYICSKFLNDYLHFYKISLI